MPQPTILELLGGAVFLAMTAANGLVEDNRTLQLDLSFRMTRNRISRVVIERNETGDMQLIGYRADRKSSTLAEVSRLEGVLPAALPAAFTSLTGLFARPP